MPDSSGKVEVKPINVEIIKTYDTILRKRLFMILDFEG
ncbi:hypothetical protein LEP1GSC083_2403 [Leptospira interrogans serovar Pyrogenes str. L0374]|uniref:Uncharacterized protein n=3 Tax=Leptospira interrogans TaxID=173 RepID=A0A829D8W4_LEPIR|nr:hypothetical protein LEP1GSC082_1140 [Leptospira kirschneri str. H2]EMF71254.1 hypothetical protein LEP1GSC148_3722 [Leptospira interrogans serovar Canicola str. LT1962]EMG23901.1 hypothetical protein LEP1GSC150_4280 [Leptospira interrogans serovar Copenhageni str. LT2050]EMN29651.1 hypothetical protein LEP1GSC083_2403 [Leptospira interrogans serovar Pyrogenes str. L0374]EMY05259.1 hypothetical protein LEP1GSC029_0468 [Leptospira interrogans str. 2002000626]